MHARSLFLSAALFVSPPSLFADTAPNAVTDWAAIVQPAIHSGAAPRSAGTSQILHTMVMLAVYDATMATEGGYEPYATAIQAAPGADARAAVATAAYLTSRARIDPVRYAYLDGQYATYLAGVPDGPAKTAGIHVGQDAAAAVLALRAGDGFANVVTYVCSTIPLPVGEFEPDTGCPSAPTSPQPVDVKLAQIRPFTFSDPARFRPDGPRALTSDEYTSDYVETRDYGRADSTRRSPEQTDVAYFWAGHPYVHWNQNLIGLAISRGLSLRETARFFAMVHTAVSDATIAGFEAKYYYRAWRPRTAIPQADRDGNPDTDPDPAWTPLLKVNHPEYPSGHAFWSTALTDAVAAFFGTNKVAWTIVTPRTLVPDVVKTERSYGDLNALMREIDDARVWAGLHWRHTMRRGAQVGRKVAAHVVSRFFRPTP